MSEDLYRPINGPSVPIPGRAVLDNVTVRTGDGRVFDLGKPSSKFFKLRVARYKWQRRHEIRAAKEAGNG